LRTRVNDSSAKVSTDLRFRKLCCPNRHQKLYFDLFNTSEASREFMTFSFTTAGESHGRALIATIEGLPAGLAVDQDFINHELWRRQQGYGRGGRMKIETDTAQILAGVRHGATLGSPVAIMVENRDFKNWLEVMATEKPQRPPEQLAERDRKVIRPRPGHADLAGGM